MSLQPKWPTDDPSLASWQSELSQCPTMTEYKDTMAAMPHESAGGVTGLTYDMVKLWPKSILDRLSYTHQFINHPTQRPICPEFLTTRVVGPYR